MAKLKKGPPLQIIIIISLSVVLMFISWYSMSSSAFQEQAKARQTAEFFLEAVGKVPAKDLGKHLYDDVRRSYTHNTLEQRLSELGLDKPITTKNWRDEKHSKYQWRWRVEAEQDQKPFDLFVYVRKPEKMSLARRWQTYTLCRPEDDLKQLLLPLRTIQEKEYQKIGQPIQDPKLTSSLKNIQSEGFVAADPSNWKIVGFDPVITLVIPGQKNNSITLKWVINPDEHLQCKYTFESYAYKTKPDTRSSGQGTMNEKSNGDSL